MILKKKVEFIVKALTDKKGFDITCLDVRKVSPITDFLIVVSGTSDRHVKALAQNLVDELDSVKEDPRHVDGAGEGAWVLVDCYDVMVHIFKESIRGFYALEELWSKGKKLKVKE